MTDAFVFRGDFRIIKMDGMFHVVYRPDSDPEWFRIIASFYTYERAWQYYDVERVLSFDGDSATTDETDRKAPDFHMPDPQTDFGVAEMVRNISPDASEAVPYNSIADECEVIDEQPLTNEEPKDYRQRTETAQGDLTPKEAAVLAVLESESDSAGVAAISTAKIASAARIHPDQGAFVPLGSVPFLLERLEGKGRVKKVEAGKSGKPSKFQVSKPASLEDAVANYAGNSDTDEKVWCDQCDKRVATAHAAACTSAFCKAKTPATDAVVRAA